MSDQVRVRFAPSPTGHLHIGSARSALFNYLLARRKNGRFIIRIEDTDQSRNVEGAEEKLLASLKWLGLDWDESVDIGGEYGPYRSMDRLDIYRNHVDLLLKQGHAYHCYCTPEELEVERQSYIEKGETPRYSGKCRLLSPEQKEAYEKEGRKPSIRFHVPEDQILKVNDAVRGEVEFDSNGIGDFVIVRPDGIPTYNFAVTIDDHLMKITHVIRGEEHLSNTPRQLVIYHAFGWDIPQFAHVSLILNQDRQKMSKRDESIIQFVEQYKTLGFLPEAIVNFVALLGWSPEGEEEILSKEEMIAQFTLERVSKSPAVFDVNKLYWMNNHYIKMASLERIYDLCLPHLQQAGLLPEKLNEEQEHWVKTLVGLYQEQLNYAKEIVDLSTVFFEEDVQYGTEEQAILAESHIPVVMEAFYKQLDELAEYQPETIQAALKSVQKETGYKGKQLFMPIRVAATGLMHGRDLPQTLYLLGKEKVLKRISRFLTTRHEK
ncbi:MAG: glutamate--tRNA ligase [Tepidibacillus sp.]